MEEDWGLPDYLIQGIKGHHGGGENGGVDPAVRLVSLLKYTEIENGTGGIETAAELEFGIEPGIMTEMMERSFLEAEEVAGMFLD